MAESRQNVVGVSARKVGAGVVAAVGVLVVSLSYLAVLNLYPVGLSSDARYWFGYAPQFAALAGLLVGTVVWRRVASPVPTPKQGALAGIATALGIMVIVPVLAGLYVILFPVLLGVTTGAEWTYIVHVFPAYLQGAVDVTRTVAVNWSLLVGIALVPLGALVGWAYQRGRRHSA